MIQQISVLLEQGEFQEINQEFYNKWQTLDGLSQYFIAVATLMIDQYEKAEPILKNLSSNATEFPSFYTYYAFVKLRLSKLNMAKRLISKESQPSILTYETNLEISIKCGNFTRAKRIIATVAAAGLTSETIRFNVGVLYFFEHNLTKAAKIFLELIEKDQMNRNAIDYFVKASVNGKNKAVVIKILENYIKTDPHLPYIWKLLGIYSSSANASGIKRMIQLVRQVNPNGAKIRECFAIPALFESEIQIENYRINMLDTILDALSSEAYPNRPDLEYGCTPFALTYHQQGNREILEALHALFSKKLIQVPKLKKRPKRKKVKLAIISTYFHDHSVMNFYKELIINMPNHYHVTIVHVNAFKIDHVTKQIYQRANQVIDSNGDHNKLVPLIVKNAYDMILYPEIGMSPPVYYLAMLRLAPIQFSIIGHPETSGMPTIDYYISWEKFHGKQPQSYFSESLVMLKGSPFAFHSRKVWLFQQKVEMNWIFLSSQKKYFLFQCFYLKYILNLTRL